MISNSNFILVTGGLGFIGSHTVIELLKKNKKIIVVDNLSNSSINIKNKIEKIAKKKIIFFKYDIREKRIETIFKRYKISSIIHFAGLKSVRESSSKKKKYFSNNVGGSKNLLFLMKKYNCFNIVFSSSACVYDEKNSSPIKEKDKLNPKSNYGRTKLKIEYMLRKFYLEFKNVNVVILRYFNPIGSHKSGIIFENPKLAENIIPNIINVINDKKRKFQIYGNDYNTKDGTCVRDYIHVVDLARSHIYALKTFKKSSFKIINIGTGKGYSVLEIIKAFNNFLKEKITFIYSPRRKGDVEMSFSDTARQYKLLKFKPKFNLNHMIKDVLNSKIIK